MFNTLRFYAAEVVVGLEYLHCLGNLKILNIKFHLVLCFKLIQYLDCIGIAANKTWAGF